MITPSKNPFDVFRAIERESNTQAFPRWVLFIDKVEQTWSAADLDSQDDLTILALTPNYFAISMVLPDEIGPILSCHSPHLLCDMLHMYAMANYPFAGGVCVKDFLKDVPPELQTPEASL